MFLELCKKPRFLNVNFKQLKQDTQKHKNRDINNLKEIFIYHTAATKKQFFKNLQMKQQMLYSITKKVRGLQETRIVEKSRLRRVST